MVSRARRPWLLITLFVLAIAAPREATLLARDGARQSQAQAPPPTQQPPQGQQAQPPTFRAGVKVVRVDVSVTGSGDKPIPDLTAADFEVTEDGVPQKVETVQFQRLDGQPKSTDETSLEIRSREHAAAEAARDDVRVFVIFFDDYHIDRLPAVTIPMRRELNAFIARLQPTDLCAIVDPLTPADAVDFTRDKGLLSDIVRRLEGRHNEIFPVKNKAEEAQLRSGDVDRLRAQVTLSALTALSVHLGGMREGRKTVIFLSQGPPLAFSSGTAEIDIRDAIEAANRANVTIDTIDPRGLGSYIRAADSMYRLAAETGGRAILNTNNFELGLRQAVEDASAYYLLGYTPTRSEDDGKYHKISVKVKRSGAHVLARQGYWAPSRKELETAAIEANRPQVPGVAVAMKTLARLEPRNTVQAWLGISRAADGSTQATVTWEPAPQSNGATVARLEMELVPAGSKTPVGQPLVVPAQEAGKPLPRATMILPPGELLLRFSARSQDGAAVDRWELPFTVPDLHAPVVAVASPRFYIASSLPEVRQLQAATDPTPRAQRSFHQNDRVFVDIECYAAPGQTPAVTAELLSSEGKPLLTLPLPGLEAGKARVELPVRGMGKGTYLLRIRGQVGDAISDQVVAFRVTP